MLSFLIPTYNLSCKALAKELSQQISASKIEAEVIVMDDGSTNADSLADNACIDSFEHCQFIRNNENIGRSRIRNLLAATAQFPTLVFLDADVFPAVDDFVNCYVKAICKADVVCGGMKYRLDGPVKIGKLRYVVGCDSESQTADSRSKAPYKCFISSNFMVKKNIFEKVQFDESLFKYGYEDVLFGKCLEENAISIAHIDNAVFHDNGENSSDFLSKTRAATENLLLIEDKLGDYSRIIKTYRKIDAFKMSTFVGMLFPVMHKRMEANLLSDKPSHFIFNIYKLSYFCHLKRKA